MDFSISKAIIRTFSYLGQFLELKGRHICQWFLFFLSVKSFSTSPWFRNFLFFKKNRLGISLVNLWKHSFMLPLIIIKAEFLCKVCAFSANSIYEWYLTTIRYCLFSWPRSWEQKQQSRLIREWFLFFFFGRGVGWQRHCSGQWHQGFGPYIHVFFPTCMSRGTDEIESLFVNFALRV